MVSQFAVIAVVIIFMVMIAMVMVYASRYKKVPPDKAMVVYGRRMGPGPGAGYRVISGGGRFIVPVIECYEFLPLDVRNIALELDEVRVSGEGGTPERVRLKASALVKVSSEPSGLDVAAEHLLHKSDAEINEIARSTMEGVARTTLRSATYHELDMDREDWAARIGMLVNRDLNNVGIEVRAFVIHDVHQRGQ